MLCYRSYLLDGRRVKELVRSIKVQPSFHGIGKKGQIYLQDFRSLMADIEPSCDSMEVLDA